MVPRAGHQGTHGRCAPTAFRSGRVRFGSAGSRDGAWGISEFRGGVGPSTPLALSTPKEGVAELDSQSAQCLGAGGKPG